MSTVTSGPDDGPPLPPPPTHFLYIFFLTLSVPIYQLNILSGTVCVLIMIIADYAYCYRWTPDESLSPPPHSSPLPPLFFFNPFSAHPLTDCSVRHSMCIDYDYHWLCLLLQVDPWLESAPPPPNTTLIIPSELVSWQRAGQIVCVCVYCVHVCVCACVRACLPVCECDSPLGHAHAVWLVADLWGLVGQVVLVDVDAQGNVLVLKVGLHLLTGLLQQAQLLERLAYSLLQRLLDAVNHLHLLHTRRKEKID